MRKYFVLLALLLAVVLPASAQQSSVIANPVQFTIPETATLTLDASNVTLNNSAPTGSVSLSYAWQVASGHTSAKIYTFLTSLNSNGFTFPAGTFATQIGTGALTPCSQTLPASVPGNPGAGLGCSTYVIAQNIATDLVDSQTVNLAVSVNPNSAPASGSPYFLTLNIVFEVI